MLVVDSSAVVELLLGRPSAESVRRHFALHDYSLHSPHLIDVEVASAIRRLGTTDKATPTRGSDAIADLIDLPIQRYSHDSMLPRVWELRENFSAYDATYVALAEALTEEGVALLTADARLARAIERHLRVAVIVAE